MECVRCGVGRYSSVGIPTLYGLDGPGIESWWGRNFPHLSMSALGPTQPPIQRVPGLSRWESGRGVMLTIHPHLALKVKERVELHMYSPLGLRALL